VTTSDFVTRALSLPWVRWQSSWVSVDCYGLVVLYFREVLGIELGGVPQTEIVSGFADARGWIECDRNAGAVAFMSWRDGAPRHCGIVLPDGMLLHAEGDEERGGRVKVTRLAAMQRLFSDVRFYRRTEC